MNRQLPTKRLHPAAVLPAYMSADAAAMDVCACLDAPITLGAGERALIPTGFAIAAPRGTVALLFARSGLAYKNGIALANSVGVVDADYRGEVKVALINHSDTPFVVEHGMRIAQLAILPVETLSVCEVDTLSETARDAGGFGSTGV